MNPKIPVLRLIKVYYDKKFIGAFINNITRIPRSYRTSGKIKKSLGINAGRKDSCFYYNLCLKKMLDTEWRDISCGLCPRRNEKKIQNCSIMIRENLAYSIDSSLLSHKAVATSKVFKLTKLSELRTHRAQQRKLRIGNGFYAVIRPDGNPECLLMGNKQSVITSVGDMAIVSGINYSLHKISKGNYGKKVDWKYVYYTALISVITPEIYNTRYSVYELVINNYLYPLGRCSLQSAFLFAEHTQEKNIMLQIITRNAVSRRYYKNNKWSTASVSIFAQQTAKRLKLEKIKRKTNKRNSPKQNTTKFRLLIEGMQPMALGEKNAEDAIKKAKIFKSQISSPMILQKVISGDHMNGEYADLQI